jgi:hypothetical protein
LHGEHGWPPLACVIALVLSLGGHDPTLVSTLGVLIRLKGLNLNLTLPYLTRPKRQAL